MATTNNTDIQKLYVAYFNRPADPVGLKFWADNIAAGTATIADVAKAFSAQAEYTAEYKDMTNAQIVDQVYQNLFGRSSKGDTGADFWVKGLENKTITVADVVTAVAAGAQLTDKTAYANKVTAAAAFTAALDSDVEIAGYKGDDANKVAKDFLSSVTTDVSLAAAITPTALNATVASAVAAGTPFSVAGALAQIDAASDAVAAFVKATVTKDVNGDGSKTATDITSAQTKAQAAVVADLTDASAKALFAASTTSQAVRDALVNDQLTALSKALDTAQGTLNDDNDDIADVDGLADAMSSLAAAKTSLTAAQTAELAARADISAKEVAFGANNGVDGVASSAVTVSGSNLVYTKAGASAATTLATIDATGKATIATGVDATKYVGLTELIASYNAEATAASNVVKAQATVDANLVAVNLLDIGPDAMAIGGVADETALLNAIVAKINATSPDTIAAGDVPTAGQILTELAVLNAKTDKTEYNAFKALLDADKADVAKLQATATAAAAADAAAAATASAKHTAALNAESGFAGGAVTASATDLKQGATTLATIDAITHKATVAAGVTDTTNPGVTALIAAYNADIDAAAAATSAHSAALSANSALTAVAPFNPLIAQQAIDAIAVSDIATAISTLTKDMAALQTANVNADKLAGLQATVTGYTDALTDKGYNAVTLDDHTISFATAKSDIYVVGAKDASVAAFGLQGTDSLFVGSGYTLVQGTLTGSKAVTGNDAAMEIFVSQVGADTVLQIETHAYSSAVTGTGTGEIVTITLSGVDASHIKLDSTGIITAPTV